jgi:HPt (histidine-containing phosphotransfer) domain-containing protein
MNLHDTHDPVDFSILKTFSDGDVEVEKKLMGLYVGQADKLLQILAENRANKGARLWSETAHALKGSSASIGAKALAELCSNAQRFGGTAEEQAALFSEIENEYVRVKDYLKTLGLLP